METHRAKRHAKPNVNRCVPAVARATATAAASLLVVVYILMLPGLP